jgi:hypothetical protein
MSTLWTPDGERPIRPNPPASGASPPAGDPDDETLSPEQQSEREEMAAQLEELRDRLASTPASLVVANHAFGLFELAALHLAQKPPKLDEAQLAIDALGALVEGLPGRLGEHEPQLRDGLAQLRIAYVELKATFSQS